MTSVLTSLLAEAETLAEAVTAASSTASANHISAKGLKDNELLRAMTDFYAARVAISAKITEIAELVMDLQNGPQITPIQTQALATANAALAAAQANAASLVDFPDEITALTATADDNIQKILDAATEAEINKGLTDGYVADIEALATAALSADNASALAATTLAEKYKEAVGDSLATAETLLAEVTQRAGEISDKASDATEYEQAALELRNDASGLYNSADGANGSETVI